MRIAERILWALIALSLALKVLHLPLSSLLLILATSLVSMLYWTLGWMLFPTPTRKHQILGLSILAGFAFTALITGMLFRIQVWPGADTQILFGLALGAATVIVVLVNRNKLPDLASYYKGLLWRTAPLMTAAALLYPVTPADMARFYYRGQSEAKIKLMQRLYSGLDEDERTKVLQSLDSLDIAESEERNN
ncbi:MAG: hypothetical protein WAT74_14800 [Flavobacteriales bacterium]